ncbi:MAG: hypothetical protein WAT23_19860, partial [Chromatiaceae bacterium]
LASGKSARWGACELLNDGDTFLVVLDYPWLSLTNNEAERALSHWVISRSIGTASTRPRVPRLRQPGQHHRDLPQALPFSPWPNLAEVVGQLRRGLLSTALPIAP